MKRATSLATHALSCLFLLRVAVCECAGVCVTHLYSILSGCCAVCLHVRVPVCVCCCICIFVLCRLLFTFLHCANTHEMLLLLLLLLLLFMMLLLFCFAYRMCAKLCVDCAACHKISFRLFRLLCFIFLSHTLSLILQAELVVYQFRSTDQDLWHNCSVELKLSADPKLCMD